MHYIICLKMTNILEYRQSVCLLAWPSFNDLVSVTLFPYNTKLNVIINIFFNITSVYLCSTLNKGQKGELIVATNKCPFSIQ